MLGIVATMALRFPSASNAIAHSPVAGLTSAGTQVSRGYQVIGNKVIGPGGHQFIPYGFVD
jgi:hypothetical protein